MAINPIVVSKYQKRARSKKDQGFTMLEAAISLTTLGITLAYAMPLFLYSKMNNSKSEIRTGAMMVAQKILDTNRGTTFSSIPTTGSITYLDKSTVSPPPGSTLADLKAMGRTYQARAYFCETASDCSGNYKTLRIEIKQYDKATYESNATVYEMSAGFTNFQ